MKLHASEITGSLSVSGSITPNGSGSWDLGSPNNPWKDLHVMSSSIHIYDSTGPIAKMGAIRGRGFEFKDHTGTLTRITGSHMKLTGNAKVIGSVTADEFVGGGAGITGVTAEWDGTHTGNGVITGDLDVSGNISGSLTSTGSFSIGYFDKVGIGTKVFSESGAKFEVYGGDITVVEDATIGGGADVRCVDKNGNKLLFFCQDAKGYLKTSASSMELILGAGSWGTGLTLNSSNNAIFTGTINSGAITSTGLITGTDLTISGTSTTIGTITSGIWNAGAITSSGGISGTTGTFSGNVTGTFVGDITGNVTGNTSGTAATVTTAAQTAITSVGTLTSFRSTGIDDNADALAITIDSSERVGIGTASPQIDLHIAKSTSGEILRLQGGNIDDTDLAEIKLGMSSGTWGELGSIGVQQKSGGGTKFMYFGTSGTDKAMVIDIDGKVGIGTTSPSYKLDIASGDINLGNGRIRFEANTNIRYADSKLNINSNSNIEIKSATSGLTLYASNNIDLQSGASNTMWLDQDGNVGIGDTTPSYKLDVNGTFRVTGAATFDGSVTATTFTGNVSGNAATVTTNANLTGDITSTGNATAIAAGVIINADVKSDAAIAYSKLGSIPTWNQSTTGNAATATKIASITNSNIVQLTTSQTLTNKTLTSPTMTAPVLGTPASGVATNLTGTAASLTAGTVTSIGNLTGIVTSTNRATAIADNAISGDKIDGGTISSFRSTGIDDNADALAITIDSSERVGIGTTNPIDPLHVSKTNAGNIQRLLTLSNYGTTDNTAIRMSFEAKDDDDPAVSRTLATIIATTVDSDNTAFTSKLSFSTRTSDALVLDTSGNATFAGDLIVTGGLTINGTTTTINSTTLSVDDKNIELGSVATPSDTTANLGGITLKGATDKTILWTNSTDTWDFNQGIKVTSGNSTFAGTINSGAITSTAGISGTTGTFTGDVSIAPTKKLYFDGAGGNTYIQETQEDYVSHYVNGLLALRLDEAARVGIGGTSNPFYARVNIPYSGNGSIWCAGSAGGSHSGLEAIYRPSLGGGRPIIGAQGSDPGWEMYHDTTDQEAVMGTRIAGGVSPILRFYYAGGDLVFGTIPDATANGSMTPRFTLGEDGNATFAGDINSSGKYHLNEQGRQDHVSNTMSSPYYRFDGINDYVDITDEPTILASQDFSICTWVKPDKYGWTDGTIKAVTGQSSSDTDRFLLLMNTATTCSINFYISNADDTSSVVTIAADSWIHLCFVRTGSTGYYYINGIAAGTDTVSTGDWELGNIGSYGNGTAPFLGQISNVKLYNTALSATEIKELYSGASVPFKYKGANQTEVVTNGDMELDANWSSYGQSTNSRSTTQKHSGTYSRKFTPSSTSDGIQSGTSAISTVAGKSYRVSFWVYPDDGTVVNYGVRNGGASAYITEPAVTGLTQDAWNYVTTTFIETVSGSAGYVIIHSGPQNSGDFYIDDVSIVQVGAVAEYDGSGATGATWYDKSGNNLDGTVTGATLENRATALIVDDRVGIGTASPGAKLEVDGGDIKLAYTAGTDPFYLRAINDALWFVGDDAATQQWVFAKNYSHDAAIHLTYTPGTTGAAAGIFKIGQQSKNDANWTHGVTAFYTNGTEQVRIDNNGNVGIGTTTPGGKFEVYSAASDGTEGITIDSAAASQTALYFSVAGTNKFAWYMPANDATKLHLWNTSAGSVMTMLSSGNVGIGTTGPRAKLEIYNTSTTSDGDGSATETASGQDSILLYGHGGTNGQTYGSITWMGGASRRRAMISAVAEGTDTDKMGLAFYTQGTDGSGDFFESMRISWDGNVGINDTTPSYKLDVNGTFRATGAATFDTTVTFAGNIATTGTGTITSVSSLTAGGTLYVDENIRHTGDTNNYINFTTDTQKFYTDGTTALTLNSSQNATFSGKVGINGPTSPAWALVVNATSGVEQSAFFGRIGASAEDHMIVLNTDKVLNNRNFILFNSSTGSTNGGAGESWGYSGGSTGALGIKIKQTSSSTLKSEMFFAVNTGNTKTQALLLDSSANATFAGTINSANGTVGEPAYSFSSQSNTGMYHPGTNQLFFSVAGSRKVRMEATQVVFENLSSGVSMPVLYATAATFTGNTKVTTSNTDTTFTIETTSGTTIFPVLDFVSSHASVGAKIRSDGSDVITFDNSLNVTFAGDVSVYNNSTDTDWSNNSNTVSTGGGGIMVSNQQVADNTFSSIMWVAKESGGTDQNFAIINQSTSATSYTPKVIFAQRTAANTFTSALTIDEGHNATFGGDVILNADNRTLKIGASNDLEIHHNGSNSIILSKTGHLIINNSHSSGNTEFEIQGSGSYVFDSSPATFAGKITADAGIDIDNFNIDGTTIALSSGDQMTLDSPGRIDLSADDNGEIRLYDGSLMYAVISEDDSRLKIKSVIQDKFILLAGNDGGNEITALTLDMAAGGNATFAGNVTLPSTGVLSIGSSTLKVYGGDLSIESAGDDINFVGSWLRIRSTDGGTINSAFRPTGELTLGADAQTTYMLKVVSGNSYFGGDILIGNTVTNIASGHADQPGIGLKYSATVPEIQVASNSTAMQLGRTTTGGHGEIMAMRYASNVIHSFNTNAVSIGTSATFAGNVDVNGGTLTVDGASGSSNSAFINLFGRNGGGYGNTVIAQSRIESATAAGPYNSDLKFYTTDDSNNLDLALTLDHDQNATFAGRCIQSVGSNNVIFGASSTGDGITSGEHNALFGSNGCGGSIEGGSYNTAMGGSALEQLVSGNDNSAFGYNTGQSSSGGSFNMAFGNQALNLSGQGNCAFGYKILRGAGTGAYNIGIGYYTMEDMSIGHYNIAIGAWALMETNNSSHNTAVGVGSFKNFNTSGDGENVGLGNEVGEFVSTGKANTFIGYHAGRGITGTRLTGSNNTLLGKGAAYTLQGNANDNVIIGTGTASNITQGYDNVIIGEGGGSTLLAGGQNVIIGQGANVSGNGVTNEIAIGRACIGQGTNTVTLGNGSCTAWLPTDDNEVNLGASDRRFANIYVADAHYSNVGTGGNDVDGTEGSWTIQEGEEDLFVINRKTGKKFKIKLEAV